MFIVFNATATPAIYTLSLHDALPICSWPELQESFHAANRKDSVVSLRRSRGGAHSKSLHTRSEEHTSELQSQFHLVCRLLLENKKNLTITALVPARPPPSARNNHRQP